MKRRIKELEEYENQMLAKFAQEQAMREGEIAAKKAEAEAARDEIYRKLEEEEQQRRAQSEYMETLRNELQVQEFEEQAWHKEQSELEKRENMRL